MIAVGCTGGVGSGKSSVTALLEQHGAVVIAADQIARRLLEQPGPAYDAVVEHFGDGIVSAGGALDRRALGRRVFSDPEERAVLESIVHPSVHEELALSLELLRTSDHVVVLELPLLVETGGRERYRLDGVLVVDAPEDMVTERLVQSRGMSADEVRARIAVQATAVERLQAADFVILNVGTKEELAEMTEGAWRWMVGLRGERRG